MGFEIINVGAHKPPSVEPALHFPMLKLPKDLFYLITRMLDPSDLTSASRCCKEWNILFSADKLWNPLVEERFGIKPKEKAKDVFRLNFTNLAKGRYATKILKTEKIAFSFILLNDGLGVSGSSDGHIKTWNLHTLKSIDTLQGHKHAVLSLIPYNRSFISSSADKTIKIWDLIKRESVSLQCGDDLVPDLMIFPDGSLISHSQNKTAIQIWDLKTLDCMTHEDKFSSVHFLARDKKNALICNFKSIRALSFETGEILYSIDLEEPQSRICSILFTKDKTQFITGSEDGAIKIWDYATGKCAITLHHPGNAIVRLCLSEEGNHLISYGKKKIRVWDLKTYQHLSLCECISLEVLNFSRNMLFLATNKTSNNEIVILDFSASHTTIYNELATEFEEGMFDGHYAMTRFLRMPEEEQKKIYEELDLILYPALSRDISRGEKAFKDAKTCGAAKKQAIHSFLKQTKTEAS